MKITGARNEPFSDMRKRALARAGAQVRGSAPPVDSTAFLGLSEADMTPAVQAAVQTLLGEIDDLRGEVGRLKARLAETEGLADRDALTPSQPAGADPRTQPHLRSATARRPAWSFRPGRPENHDRFGHAAGDAAIRAVAERLLANVRESDIVGRMGGDEFAVILAQADHATAEGKAAQLARAIEAEPLRFGDWSAPLHVSWGVREITQDAEPEALVAEADAAMYLRKRDRKTA